MINVGDILSTVEGVQYRGGYHEYRGGVILSTVGDLQYCGGYHESYHVHTLTRVYCQDRVML